jgi:hypothetical protein
MEKMIMPSRCKPSVSVVGGAERRRGVLWSSLDMNAVVGVSLGMADGSSVDACAAVQVRPATQQRRTPVRIIGTTMSSSTGSG